MNPYEAVHNLASALKKSEEFKQFIKAQKDLKADETAKKMVLDLRGKQLELHRQKLSGIEVSKEQEERLEKLSEVVGMNMVAKNYLQAEYKVLILLQDIQKIISDATNEIFDEELINVVKDEEAGDQE